MLKWRSSKRRRLKNGRRFRDRPIAALLQWGVCLGLIACGSFAFYRYACTSSLLSIKWIRVEGTILLDPNEVLAKSEITTADNLLQLNVDAVHRRVVAMPYIKSCTVDRTFPNRVVLSVVERVAKATLLVDNRLFEVDGEGVVLRELLPLATHVGPLITNVPDLLSVELGQQIAQDAFRKALAVWNAFGETAMAIEVTVSELAALDTNKIVMFCDELPFEIRWGRGNLSHQADNLDILWRSEGMQIDCDEYLDLRFGRDLICK